MKHRAFLSFAFLALLGVTSCDGAKKSEAAHGEMAGMEAQEPGDIGGSSVTVGDITVSDAWAPVTPVGARVAAGYLTIKNSGAAEDKLLSISSPRAKSAELHEMLNENGMMTMRAVKSLVLKPGEEVKLEPGKLHLMLLDPALPYADAEMLPVTLTFEHAGKIEAQLLVRPRDIATDEHGAH